MAVSFIRETRMPEKYLEENRFLYIESGLGPNELLLESFTGTEGISQLFRFELELLSENRSIKFEDILGQPVSFGVLGPEGRDPRDIHGMVTAFTQLPDSPRLARYRAVVSPKLWLLTRRQNCRIFQQLSVPDILKKVFSGLDAVWELHGQHDRREYCVQYHETDFAFASRLMEEEGIFYFFRFTRGAHKLVVADSPVSHQDVPGEATLTYEETTGGQRDEARIWAWVKSQELGPGKYSLQDYCYGIPASNMMVNQQILDSAQVGKVTHKLKAGGNDQLEIYDYPGGYGMRAQAGGSGARPHGDAIAKWGVESMEAAQFAIRGESNAFQLIPGCRFTLTRHPNADGAYVLTSVTHAASEGGFHSAADIGKNHYDNRFRVIPMALPFRPARVTPKPHVWGCQTAVVVGPAGEEIYTDDQGRIKVQFHWDREGKRDASSSCWIRVATVWAGGRWGAIRIPRMGHEVVVDFLEGDPDCPIVVGSVYNGQNPPPYVLPDNKTQSGILSRSSKGGGAANANEILLEDKKGSELVQIHAEKNLNTEVENDETRTVGRDRTTTIQHDDTCTIKHDHSTVIEHDETRKAHNHRTTTIGVNDTTQIGGDMRLAVGGSRSAEVGKNDRVAIGVNQMVSVGGSESTSIGGSERHLVGGSRSTTVSGPDTLTAATITISAGGGVTITAPAITLNAPIVQVAGIVQCTSLVSSLSITAPLYSSGIGNLL